MTDHIVKPLSFFAAIKQVAWFYVHVYKHIVGLAALAALVQVMVSLLAPQHPVGFAISLFGSIVSLFIYAWTLYRADSILMNRLETLHDALHVAKKRFLPLIGVFVIFSFLLMTLFLFGFGMQALGNVLHLTAPFALFTLALAVFVLVLFAFTMPAVILEKMPIFKSFEHSVKLVWDHWWRTFGILLVYIIPVMLLSLAMLLLPTRNTLTIAIPEFIYYLIIYPLMVALMLVLYHDLKTRHHMKGFQHLSEHEK